MTGPLNEHADYAAYEAGGLDAVYGIPRDRALSLAKVLSIEATRMDPRHPSTAIVKRDISRIYELLHPEPEAAPPAQREHAQQVIDQLKGDPAYRDPAHANHAAVSAQLAQAYEVVHRGQVNE